MSNVRAHLVQQSRFVAFVIAILVCASVAFGLGFREGARASLMVDALPRGSIAVGLLGKANQGVVTQNMVTTLEADVDTGLLQAHQLEQYRLAFLVEPLAGVPVTRAQQSVARMADYRKDHPSPLAEGDLSSAELNQALAYSRQIIASMVATHASGASGVRR